MIAYENLCLLGFLECSKVPGELKSLQGFKKAMLSSIGSSQKLTECVFAFLLQLFNAREFQMRFKSCWPIADRKIQPKEFRNQLYKWLEQLRKEGTLSIDFPLRRSYLDEGKGERFERMIVFLSEMIMIKEMTGGGSPVPELFTSQTSVTLKRLGPSEKRRLEDLLAAHVKVETKLYLNICQKRHNADRKYLALMSQIDQECERLETELQNTATDFSSSNSKNQTPNNFEDFTESDKVKQLKDYWKAVDEQIHNSSLQESIKLLKMFLDLGSQNFNVDCLQFQAVFPERFRSSWETYLQESGISLITPSGMFDIGAICELLNLCLSHYKSLLGMEVSPKYVSAVSESQISGQSIDANFQNLRKLDYDACIEEHSSILHQMERMIADGYRVKEKLENELKQAKPKVSEYKFKSVPRRYKLMPIDFFKRNETSLDEAPHKPQHESTPLAVQTILNEQQRYSALQTPINSHKVKRLPRLIMTGNSKTKSAKTQLMDIKSKLFAEEDVEEKENDETFRLDVADMDSTTLFDERPPFEMTPTK